VVRSRQRATAKSSSGTTQQQQQQEQQQQQQGIQAHPSPHPPLGINTVTSPQPRHPCNRSPYTFKDSLKNPFLRKVYVFHNIGLDRLVNTYRNPVLVTRPVTYQSCAGTTHVSRVGGWVGSGLGFGLGAF